jgi:hypothetical protein
MEPLTTAPPMPALRQALAAVDQALDQMVTHAKLAA